MVSTFGEDTGNGPASGGGRDRSVVVTPDAVGLDLELASVGSRGAAYLLDAAILLAGTLSITIGQALLGFTGFVPGWAGIAVLLVLGFVLLFGYPIGFETLNHGRTPGKMVMGLRVVTVEGAPGGVRHATIRAATGLFELLGTSGAIAIITSFSTARSQRLGDLVAGTLVVRQRTARREGAPTATRFQAPGGLEGYVQSLDVTALGPGDYTALRDTLQRLGQLPPEVRSELADSLARQMAPRVQPPPPAGLPAETFLQCLAAAVQRRRARGSTAGADAASAPAQPAAAAPPAPSASPGDRSTSSEGTRPSGSSPSPSPEPSPPIAPERDRDQRPSPGTGFAPPD